MKELNRRAMSIPSADLVSVLEEAIAKKQEIIEERDRIYGKGRVYVHSYGENIYLPETFNFDMRDYYKDPQLALDIELRRRIFWLDNSHDDGNFTLEFPTTASMYYDMTLFGIKIDYTKNGVPNMRPHPLSEKADLSLIEPFDFEHIGEMPLLLDQYESFKRLSAEKYENKLTFSFPKFIRGPLDIYVQLRGYENFVDDAYDDPDFIHSAMDLITQRRFEYNKAVQKYLGLDYVSPVTQIDDDWINFPFITPAMYHEFVVPAYKKIIENEGDVIKFHTCGVLEPIVAEIAELFPKMHTLDLSGWNDVLTIDRDFPKDRNLWINFINTFVLAGTKEEHIDKLQKIRSVSEHRKVDLCAQAFVRIHPTLDESFGRMNDFIDLAHEILYK